MKVLLVYFLSFGQSAVGRDFDCTLKRHLDAIQAKDYQAFEATLSKERLTFILPNGAYSEDPTEYRKALKEWFTSEKWTFSKLQGDCRGEDD